MGTIETRLKELTARLGFCLTGIARAVEADGFAALRRWLAAGHHGTMRYMETSAERRRHPAGVLAPVRSVIMVGLEDTAPRLENPPAGWPGQSGVANGGKVARYALGRDYHDVIWRRLDEVQVWLREAIPGALTRAVADSAPLLERDFARRAGLGWIGKNTMLINKYRGSYVMLGAVLTDAELEPDASHDATHCGTCTRCLTACPTGAFPEPGVLDARKCISYLTIEKKGRLDESEMAMVGDWVFGCDICQDVCPWNRKSREETFMADASELLRLTPEEFRLRFQGTAATRPRRHGIARNAAIALGTTGDATALPALLAAREDPDESVREAAEWAIGRIRSRITPPGHR
jgi:epoxyqueuosine reductase